MRGYINKNEIRMFILSGFLLIPIGVLCYQEVLSLGPLTSYPVFALLLLMLVCSNLELPFIRTRSKKPSHLSRDSHVLGYIHSVPLVEDMAGLDRKVFNTILSLNVGGGLIPGLVVCILLLNTMDLVAIEIMLIIVVAVTLLSDFVDGVGVVVPDYICLLPVPLALIFSSHNAAFVIFTSGVGGTLLGIICSVLRLNKEKRGSHSISIGGAGSFRVIFATTLIAVLISGFMV